MNSHPYRNGMNMPMMTPEAPVSRSPHGSFTARGGFPLTNSGMAPMHLAGHQGMPMNRNLVEGHSASPMDSRPVPPPIAIPNNMADMEHKKAQGLCHQAHEIFDVLANN
jgi:hypothetical protein